MNKKKELEHVIWKYIVNSLVDKHMRSTNSYEEAMIDAQGTAKRIMEIIEESFKLEDL